MNITLPIMKFQPIIKPLPWGGRKLKSIFGKQLPDELPCGESWEVVDLPDDNSKVEEGLLASKTLGSLVKSAQEDLLGDAQLLMGRFPVLYKFIDARQTLSVQVHPDEEAVKQLGGSARPKTEAWYILQADPGAKLYLGFKEGVGIKELEAALQKGTVEELLYEVIVKPGDFVYLPSGTMHAIGGGIVLAEIQQASDTTYRVFDWNRLGLDGKPRQLHVQQALASINFDIRGLPAHAAPASGRPGIRCPDFSFEKVSLGAEGEAPVEAGRPKIISCIDGHGTVSDVGTEAVELNVGQTCMVPACRAASLSSRNGGVFLLIRV
jgi:mannose-6-phosphate isomerase